MKLIADSSERIDKFLPKQLTEHSRSKLTKMIDEGLVTVGGKAVKASFKLEPGMEVDLPEPAEADPHDLTPADIPLKIAYDDEDMIIVDKPRGLATHPAASLKEPSLVNALLALQISLSSGTAAYRPGIVHRLDKETTGLIVIAKNDAAHVHLAKQIEEKSAVRRYFAVVHGDVEQSRFTVDAPIGRDKTNRLKMAVEAKGKRAVTHISKIARLDSGTLIAVKLETGRTHQIRVHLRAIGHPVLGDKLYTPKPYSDGALQLHAGMLVLEHPKSGATIECFSQPPEDFFGAELCTREAIEFE